MQHGANRGSCHGRTGLPSRLGGTPPGERRRALLQKRGHALTRLVGGEQLRRHLRGPLERLVGAELGHARQQLLGRGQTPGSGGEEVVDDRVDLGVEPGKIGRASGRERGGQYGWMTGGPGTLNKTKKTKNTKR